jgi:molybdenum-dependent DNA-binding transcriptional regulator ModE
MTIEVLLALLKAGAILVGQESVKLATKQAYEALRGKLVQILGKPAVEAAEAGDASGVSAAALREKLLAAGASERQRLDDALATVMDDPALQAVVPGRLYASLREAKFSGAITIVAEDHDQVVIDARRAEAESFSLSSKKSRSPTP